MGWNVCNLSIFAGSLMEHLEEILKETSHHNVQINLMILDKDLFHDKFSVRLLNNCTVNTLLPGQGNEELFPNLELYEAIFLALFYCQLSD